MNLDRRGAHGAWVDRHVLEGDIDRELPRLSVPGELDRRLRGHAPEDLTRVRHARLHDERLERRLRGCGAPGGAVVGRCGARGDAGIRTERACRVHDLRLDRHRIGQAYDLQALVEEELEVDDHRRAEGRHQLAEPPFTSLVILGIMTSWCATSTGDVSSLKSMSRRHSNGVL